MRCRVVMFVVAATSFAVGCDSREDVADVDADVDADIAASVRLDADGDPRYRAFADEVAAELVASGVPGGAIGIVAQGRLVFATGLGNRRAGHDEPVGVDTAFRVASTSKPFTAAAVMSLVDDRVVSLDAPVTRYAPELSLLPPQDPAQLTLRRLLSHTAGVPDYLELECDESEGAPGRWFAAHPNLALWSPPGRLWSYSNLGYSLAGWIAERATGQRYRDIVEERLLEPLGMETATFDVDEVVARGDYAVAHPTAPPIDITLSRCALSEPPGYLYASVRDLAAFTEGLLHWGGGVVEPLSLLQMMAPQTSTQAPPDQLYALGLIEGRHNGKLIVGHPGDLPGMHSAWWMVPGERFGVIVLVNGDGYSPTAVALRAIDRFLATEPTPPTDWSTPPSDWHRYVGRYDGRRPAGAFPPGGLGLLEVTLEGDRLFVTTLEDGARYPLVQAARDAFLALVGDAQILVTFWRGVTGRAEYIATRSGHARRTWAAPPRPHKAAGDNALVRGARERPVDAELLLLMR